MGTPPLVPLVACLLVALVLALEALGRRALVRVRRRPGRLRRLLDGVVGLWLRLIYVGLALTTLAAAAGWALLTDPLALPPEQPGSPAQAFAILRAPAPVRPGGPADLPEVRARLLDAVTYLQGVAQTHAAPADYRLQLAVDAWLVKRQRYQRGASDTLLRVAAQDLEAKAAYARQHPTEPFARIPVQVTARDAQARPLLEWDVRFCLKALAPYTSHHRSFDPSGSQALPPGDYLLWARRPDYMLWTGEARSGTPPQELTLGDQGEPERRVDLLTPVNALP
ncbi:MAG TPA: hypothetical protein VGD78_23575 [Chthoniobacterales bacterium]